MITPRLDILIYAHDGRGLGHAGRSIGIGMALRRLCPYLKVLFVSGCRQSQQLIGPAPLDWLKLPAYETKVEDGKSKGITGRSMFEDKELGIFRTEELEYLVSLYRPRLVLVDHTPQGKHKELLKALSISRDIGTRWILGVRGVMGAVSQAGSDLAGNLFRQYYHGLLWYGDRRVLGESHLEGLRQQYGVEALECGYVSRLAELDFLRVDGLAQNEMLAGTVSVPWLGEKSLHFLEQLARGLANIPRDFGKWHLFVDTGDSPEVKKKVWKMFAGLTHCRLERPGVRYVDSLLCSKTAVIYGGYNSLMDILYVGLPALVVEREMQDNEQQIHLQRLLARVGDQINTVSEADITGEEIASLLLDNLLKSERLPVAVNLNGATEAAKILDRLLQEKICSC